MFQYIVTAADLFVLGFLFYWFMNRIGERRLNKVWIYPAAYGAFSAFCLLTQFSRSNWIITISIVLAVLFLETVLFKSTGAAYLCCAVDLYEYDYMESPADRTGEDRQHADRPSPDKMVCGIFLDLFYSHDYKKR